MICQWHLVRVHSLFDTEFWDDDIERAIENANDSSGTDDCAESLCEIVDQVAEMEMGRLLLSDLGGICGANKSGTDHSA
jgi:hypothetical protein